MWTPLQDWRTEPVYSDEENPFDSSRPFAMRVVMQTDQAKDEIREL